MHDPSLTTTETKKTMPIGSVIVNSGTTLNLEATNSIKLTAGFKALSGSHFKATTDGTNPNTRSSTRTVPSCGFITKVPSSRIEYRLTQAQSANWVLKGYETSIAGSGESFLVPEDLKKGQYSLHARTLECPLASVVFSVENNLDCEPINQPNIKPFNNNENLRISPNPARMSVAISVSSNVSQLHIFDSHGHLLSSYEDLVPENQIEINISHWLPGTYYVHANFVNGIIENEKLVVQ